MIIYTIIAHYNFLHLNFMYRLATTKLKHAFSGVPKYKS